MLDVENWASLGSFSQGLGLAGLPLDPLRSIAGPRGYLNPKDCVPPANTHVYGRRIPQRPAAARD